MSVTVTQADVRDFVEKSSADVGGVNVDAVVAELNARLELVGEHPESTVLTAATVQQWIALRVEQDLDEGEYERILRNNVT